MADTCFFCGTGQGERSLVCPACGRDAAIPLPLAAEHQALSQKRERLRAELVEAKARLDAHRCQSTNA